MRHSNILRSSQNSIISNDECSNSKIEGKPFTQQKCSDNTSSHSFTHCSWNNNGLTSNGGAIHLRCDSSQPLISLTVDDCTFLHCYETNGVGGGGVYAENIGSAVVTNSFFSDCQCAQNTTGPEGAGVLLDFINTLPSIKCCDFVSCITGDDGGGCGIWYSHSSITYAVDSCNYIKCKGTKPADSEGAGVILHANSDFLTCTNCLFYACDAPFNGGGVSLSFPSGASLQPLTFCFFRENLSQGFRDVYLRQFPSSPPAIAYSFSCEYESGKVGGGEDDWLPQSTLCYDSTKENKRNNLLNTNNIKKHERRLPSFH